MQAYKKFIAIDKGVGIDPTVKLDEKWDPQ